LATLFISDLHLTTERPAIGEAFLRFLEGEARRAEALYILGDLFEIWLGDDAVVPVYQPFIDGLRALTDNGTPCYVMRGNRDFLLGETFEAMTGTTLLPDPYLLDLYGTPTLLMHGDLLCTDDVEYLKFRDMVLSEAWQKEFLGMSVAERVEYGRQLREKSREAIADKQVDIMDVNPAAVEETMREYGVSRLIHGHTHRPAVHEFSLDGKSVQRIVLPEWYEQGGVLVCTPQGCESRPLTA
jgi:UDP-2,3-diacylglucosamine hydrolase